MGSAWQGIIQKYRKFLPLKNSEDVVTLLEGNTPLISVPRLATAIKFPGNLFLKFEGLNPTASFKDRGMTYAISKAKSTGAHSVICASTGNTAASAAAYAARAGMKCFVLIPQGKVALGKLSQAAVHGAQVIKIDGNFDQALKLVREVSEKLPITLVNSLNPFRIEGQKTAAFEVCDALHRAPDFHAMPVGNAGNITAYWKGYREYSDIKKILRLPRMLGFQAEGAAPIVDGEPVENPETIATAIRIGNPASWKSAELARDESGGVIEKVSDDEIMQAYDMVASLEGVFCEPASAASIAGVRKMSAEGLFSQKSLVVCTLTGHGLKDPQVVLDRDLDEIVIKAALDPLIDVIQEKHHP